MEYPHRRPFNLLGALNVDSARGRAREIYSRCFLQPWTPRFAHFPLSRVASESSLSLSLRARFFLSAERPSSYLYYVRVLYQEGREGGRETEANTAARRIPLRQPRLEIDLRHSARSGIIRKNVPVSMTDE